MVPIKLDNPERSASVPKLKILPTARFPRFIGVTSMVASVPRSFSPAMESGAMDIQPEYRKMSISMGKSCEKSCPTTSFSEARSKPSPRLISNLLDNALSKAFSAAATS